MEGNGNENAEGDGRKKTISNKPNAAFDCTHLLHGRSVNSKRDTEPVFRTELGRTGLGRPRDGVGKGFGLVRDLSGLRRDRNGEVGVLLSARSTRYAR